MSLISSEEKKTLLSHFPYPSPRGLQVEVLSLLEKNWDKYDVFCIQAPTAAGKSAIAKSLMSWKRSVSYITPTNQLVDQFCNEFPDTRKLSRLDSYFCNEWRRPCSSVRSRRGSFCNTKNSKCGACPASKDLSTALYTRGPGVYNYHIYTAHKLYRDVLVVDEAHNLINYIRDRLAIRIWRHDYPYPLNAYSNEALLKWLLSLPANKQAHKKIHLLHSALRSVRPEYIVRRTTAEFNGKGTVRGEPEERECIELLPVDITSAPKFFWPSQVSKVVLLSATINHKDIAQLGMPGRICYLECKSPIPADRRPILVDPVVNVNRYNMDYAASEMGWYISSVLEGKHTGKGVIHATYQMSRLLQKHLVGPKYLFHTQENKAEQYRRFLKSPPGTVLIACGMYEGIDLPGDLGEWQVITKIPWMSLGNPAIKYMADRDTEWYAWETLKTVIQACGRVCRTPEDRGTTYVLDGTFTRLYEESNHLMPQWFLDALQNG